MGFVNAYVLIRGKEAALVDTGTPNSASKIAGPNPQYTADMAQAHQSVKKLAKLKFQRAVFGHGDPIAQVSSLLQVCPCSFFNCGIRG